MFSSLQNRMDKLPSRQFLSPLRERWPELCGCSYQLSESVWVFVVFSNDREDNMGEIAPMVHELLEHLGLSRFTRYRKTLRDHYTFQLVDQPGETVIIPTSLL